MSMMKRMLEQLADYHGDGIHSGERNTDSKGHLSPHPSVDNIDPIEVRGADHNKDKAKFKADVGKRVAGKDNDDKLTESVTKPAGEHNHTHEFIPGEQRTTTDEGHDHAIVYENGKPVKTGPGPHDGHIHEISSTQTESEEKKKFKNKKELVDFVKTQLGIELENDTAHPNNKKRNLLYTKLPLDKETQLRSLFSQYGIGVEDHIRAKGLVWLRIK